MAEEQAIMVDVVPDDSQQQEPQQEPQQQELEQQEEPQQEEEEDSGERELPTAMAGQQSTAEVTAPADVALAERHALEMALTQYDEATDTFKWRSVWRTTREELGQYGVGLQLYFELLYYLGISFGVMTLLTLPLASLAYLGDFAGSAAGLFVRLTLGNLGKCGEFGELCPDSFDVLDRTLFDSTSWGSQWMADSVNWKLRDVAMVLGILDAVAALVIFLLVVHLDRNVIGKIVREQDEANVTPADFSVQVLLLPRRLVPDMHANYAQLVKEHFERLVGVEGSVSEVTLVRDYDRSVAVFMEIGELKKEVLEYKARVADWEQLPSLTRMQRKQKQLAEKYVEKCEKKIKDDKKKLKKQRNVLDSERDVITAFVIFNDEKYKELVLHKYRWANKGALFRFFQSRKIRFIGRPLMVREAPEPSDLYQENLDMPKRQKTVRRCMTGCFSFGLLLLCTGLMVWAQSALLNVSVADESSTVWVFSKVPPESPTTSSGQVSNKCFSACELQVYPDRSCEVSDLLEDITVFDSTLQLDPARRLANGEYGGEKSTDLTLCSATSFWFPAGQNDNSAVKCGELEVDSAASEENNTCDLPAVAAILSTSLTCGNDFWTDPCCYSTTEITAGERSGDLACDAHEWDYRVPKGALTVAEWVDDICSAKTAFDAQGYGACTQGSLDKLKATSPACNHLFSVSGSRVFCECKADVDALLTEQSNTEFPGLECSLQGASAAIAASTSGNPSLLATLHWDATHATLQERLLWGCEDNGRIASITSTETSELRVWLQSAAGDGDVTFLTEDASLTAFGEAIAISTTSTELEYGGANMWTRVNVKIVDETVASAATVEAAMEAILGTQSSQFSFRTDVVTMEEAELCGEGYVQCAGTEECIAESRVCDGFPDCAWERPSEGVAWDEASAECVAQTAQEKAQETNPETGCLANQFVCASGAECVEDVYWCDGENDCADGSDETNEECVTRKLQLQSASMPSIDEWAGFRFSDFLAPECVKMAVTQAVAKTQGEEASRLKVFNCEETAVFRNNKVTLRDPYLLCRAVATVGFSFKAAQTYLGVKQMPDAEQYAYTVRATTAVDCQEDADCGEGMACIDGETQLKTVTANRRGTCKMVTESVSSYAPITYDPNTCPLSRPVSIVAARAVHQKYQGEKEKIMKDPTYNCYCEQQVQYRISSDPLYLFGPYDTEDKKICEEYLKQQIVVQSMVVASILAVSFLNFFLRTTMMFFADFEKHDSLSAKVFSEMRKLFLVLFVNTAVIILLVNAKFQNIAEYTVVGFGKGSFSDFTRDWFVVVGAGFAVTIIVQTLSIIVAPIATGYLFYWLQKRGARSYKTQEKMNTYYEYPEFSLSLRLAQTLMIVFACLLYSGGVPVLNLLAFLYIVLAYWADKWVLLRLSKIPPQYDADMVSTASKLMVVAVLLHCVFSIYMFTNQIVLPSDFINTYAEDHFLTNVDISRYYEYLFSDIPQTTDALTFFIKARLLDSFRKGAIGNLVVAAICVVYLSFGNVMRICFAIIRFMRGICKCAKSGPEYSGTTQETYNESVNEMIRNRLVHTYQGDRNPRYAAAFRAIAHLDQETSTMRAKTPETGAR